MLIHLFLLIQKKAKILEKEQIIIRIHVLTRITCTTPKDESAENKNVGWGGCLGGCDRLKT
jgi:hypothetical protein